MSQDLTLPERRPFTIALAGLGGALLGLLAGLVVVAAIWLVTFANALSGEQDSGFPFIVSTGVSGGEVEATTGPGAILLPLALCVVGLLAGVLIAAVVRRRPGHGTRNR